MWGAKRVGIGAIVVGLIGIGVAAATFPYGNHRHLTTAYFVAISVGCAGIVWGLALVVSPRWRWLGVGFAAIATAYVVLLAILLIHSLPR